MSENWVAVDRYGKVWYPYIMGGDGEHEVLLHHEEADTDMGDLTMAELITMLRPVRVVLHEDVKIARATVNLDRAQRQFDEAVAEARKKLEECKDDLSDTP